MAALSPNPLFDAWAKLYDNAKTRGTPAEQRAYDALTLADVDRRRRTLNLHGATSSSEARPTSSPLARVARTADRRAGHPSRRFTLRLRLLQLRAGLRQFAQGWQSTQHINPTHEGPDLSASTWLSTLTVFALLAALFVLPVLLLGCLR